MIRTERFLISQKPYAVDLGSISGTHRARSYPVGDRWDLRATSAAVWFRRKDGRTRACIGTLDLWGDALTETVDLANPNAVLTVDLDGRYGGECKGRWDGERYWGSEDLEVQQQHLEVLRPMLANYPAIPEGFDGWWRFR